MTAAWERAIRQGDVEALKRLAAVRPEIEARDAHGQTALMIAATEGHGPVVSWLIERGAAVYVTAKYGLSALMLAVVRGHADVVGRLVAAGADRELRGTGAPGFADKTALDLALERNDRALLDALRSPRPTGVPGNRAFVRVSSWEEARPLLTFQPREPTYVAGASLTSLSVHLRDHKLRDLPTVRRTLEAHYDTFSLSQCRPGVEEARRRALVLSYGGSPMETKIFGHDARAYERGPEPAPGDPDARMPAVVTWHDGEMHFFLASDDLAPDVLLRIAHSLYV